MDNFKKDIIKTYESEFSANNPESAWLKFEKENLSEDKKRVVYWKPSLAAFILLGLIASVFYFTSTKNKAESQFETSIFSSPDKAINTDEQEVFEAEKLKSLSKEIVEEKELKRFQPSIGVKKHLESKSLSSTSNFTTFEDNSSVNITQEFRTPRKIFQSPINLSKNKIELNNTLDNVLDKRQNLRETKNGIDINRNIEKLTLLETTSLAKVSTLVSDKNFNDLPDLKDVVVKNKSNLKFFLGASLGMNDLNHRFISKGYGANFGLISGLYLNDRFSLRTQLAYGQRKFSTLYNSQALRISSIQLRTLEVNTEKIVKDYEHLNLTFALSYSLIKKEKYFLDLSAGLQNKWDLNQENRYNLSDGENKFTESIQTKSDFNYPLFYEYSIGLGTNIYGSKLILRPYVSTQLRKSGSTQPSEIGISAEFIHQF